MPHTGNWARNHDLLVQRSTLNQCATLAGWNVPCIFKRIYAPGLRVTSVYVCLIKFWMLFTLSIALQFLWLLYLSVLHMSVQYSMILDLSISLCHFLLYIKFRIVTLCRLFFMLVCCIFSLSLLLPKILLWRLENQLIFVIICMECLSIPYFQRIYAILFSMCLSGPLKCFLFHCYSWHALFPSLLYLLSLHQKFLQSRYWIHLLLYSLFSLMLPGHHTAFWQVCFAFAAL